MLYVTGITLLLCETIKSILKRSVTRPIFYFLYYTSPTMLGLLNKNHDAEHP